MQKINSTTIFVAFVAQMFVGGAIFTASGECALEQKPGGQSVVLRNETLQVTVEPGAGGKISSILDLKNGIELTTWPELGSAEDRFWVAANQADFSEQAYDAEIIENTPQRAALLMKVRGNSAGFTDMMMLKTVSIESGKHLVNIKNEFRNTGENTLPVGLWVMNNLGEFGGANRLYVPTSAGVLEAIHRPKGPDGQGPWVKEGPGVQGSDRFAYSFARGWSGILSGNNLGAVCIAEPEKLSCLYNWLSGGRTHATIEMIFSKFTLAGGESWSTEYQILPLAKMSRLDGAGGAAAGSIELSEEPISPGRTTTAKATFLTGAAGDYQATMSLRASSAGETATLATKLKTLTTRTAEPFEVEFDFAPPKEGGYVIRLELRDADDEMLFDMEKPFGVESSIGKYTLARNFEPIGEEMTRFKQSDSTSNLALTVPRGQRGYADYEIVSDYVTPHRPWAKPYSKGPIKVLATETPDSIREVVELDQRMDMSYTTIFHHPTSGTEQHPVYADIKAMSEFERARWEELLQNEYDLIILGGTPIPYYPEDIWKQIMRKVEKGAGLLTVAPPAGWRHKESWLNEICESAEDVTAKFTASIPLNSTPYLQRKKMVSFTPYGEGRIYRVVYDTNKIRPASGTSIIPMYTYANAKKAPQEVDGMPLHEYCYAFIARVALAAAGAEPDAKLSLDGLPAKITAAEALSGEFFAEFENTANNAGKIEFELHDKFGSEIWTRESSPTEGEGKAAIPPLGNLKSGAHVITARLLDTRGKVLDWQLRDFEVESEATLADLAVEPKRYRNGDILQGSVTPVKNADTPDTDYSLLVEIVEDGGRIIGRQSVPTAKIRSSEPATFAIEIREPLWRSAKLKVQLLAGDRVLDERHAQFYCEPAEKDDIYFISYGPLGIQRHIDIGMNAVYDRDYAASLNLADVTWRGGPNIYTDFSTFGDSSTSVRKPCFTDPEFRDSVRQEFEKIRDNFGQRPPISYVFADEWKYGGRNTARPNLCMSPTCLEGFRQFALERHGSLENINKAWGSSYSELSEIIPPLTAETDRRLTALQAGEDVNFTDWLDHKLFIEHVVADFFGFCQASVGDAFPIGLSGTQRVTQSYMVGLDLWQLFGENRMMAVNLYSGSQLEIVRSFAGPDHFVAPWGGGYDIEDIREKPARLTPWATLCRGFAGLSYYLSSYSPIEYPDYTLRKQGLWLKETLKPIREEGLARLIRQSAKETPRVAIHYSPASLHTERLFKLMQPAVPFHGPNLDSLTALFKALGIPFDFVAGRQIEDGELQNYSLLFLPFSHAVSTAELVAIREFVAKGGVAVADVLAPELTRRVGGAPLWELFGVEPRTMPDFKSAKMAEAKFDPVMPKGSAAPQASTDSQARYLFEDGTPAFITRVNGDGTTVYLNFSFHEYSQTTLGGVGGEDELITRASLDKRLATESLMGELLDIAEVTPEITITQIDDGLNFGGEIVRFSNGEAEYIVIMRMEDSGMISEKDIHKVRIDFGSQYHVYNTLTREYHGETDSLETTLTDGKAAMFALLPRQAQTPELAVRNQAKTGRNTEVRIELGPGTKGAVILTALDPDGRERYRRIVDYVNGVGASVLPFAFNDPVGEWRIVATDAASGAETTRNLTLSQ